MALECTASQAAAAAADPAGARNKKKKRGKSTAAGVAAADAAEPPTETVIEAHGMEQAAVATAVPVVLEEDNGVLQQEVEVPLSEVVPPAAKAVSDNAPTKATSAETTTPVEASPSPSVRARREQLAAATASPPAPPAPPAGSVTPVTLTAGGGG